MQGVAGRHQPRKMLFCLAEAVRERVRAKLAAARSVTIHSDASKNRLLLLCEMCGDDLVPGHCLLGAADLEDDCSAAGLMTTVLRILKDTLTPLMGAPWREVETTKDLQAWVTLRASLKCLTRMRQETSSWRGACCSVLIAAEPLATTTMAAEPPPQVAQVAMAAEPQPFRLQFFLI